MRACDKVFSALYLISSALGILAFLLMMIKCVGFYIHGNVEQGLWFFVFSMCCLCISAISISYSIDFMG